MTDLDIMRLALDALTSGVDVQMGRVVRTEYDSCLIAKAITALRERLAQPEQERMAKRIEELEAQLRIGTSNSDVNPYALLQNARIIEARPEQEPVAWGVFDHNLHDMFFTKEDAQEMVRLKGDGSIVKPLYTTPLQRKPLTNEEVVEVLGNLRESITGNVFLAFARAIEAAHGIKGDT